MPITMRVEQGQTIVTHRSEFSVFCSETAVFSCAVDVAAEMMSVVGAVLTAPGVVRRHANATSAASFLTFWLSGRSNDSRR